MKITRDVISDLLPVYLAREACQDTRDLVEAFLKGVTMHDLDAHGSQTSSVRNLWTKDQREKMPEHLD